MSRGQFIPNKTVLLRYTDDTGANHSQTIVLHPKGAHLTLGTAALNALRTAATVALERLEDLGPVTVPVNRRPWLDDPRFVSAVIPDIKGRDVPPPPPASTEELDPSDPFYIPDPDSMWETVVADAELVDA